MRAVIERILGEAGPEGSAGEAQVAADWCADHGLLELEASMLDRARGLDPDDDRLFQRFQSVLDRLALVEHGITWRYVPEGTFLMGSSDGDPDEKPVHPVRGPAFRMADVPISWTRFAALMGWPEPPAWPKELRIRGVWNDVGLWLHFCADRHQEEPSDWDARPLVAVSPRHADLLAERLDTEIVKYSLPTEEQWEKAARGGLIGRRYPWGDEPPTPDRCDADHFGHLVIVPSRSLPPNGYGLYAMCGGVSEWTSTLYDSLSYEQDKPPVPEGDREHVLRGGSFVDCPAAVTVSFRSSFRPSRGQSPTVGLRLIRT